MATKHGFVNRTAELNFILTMMQGRARNELLGITDLHYQSAGMAEIWYNRLCEESEDCVWEAKDKLRDIYRDLVEDYL